MIDINSIGGGIVLAMCSVLALLAIVAGIADIMLAGKGRRK